MAMSRKYMRYKTEVVIAEELDLNVRTEKVSLRRKELVTGAADAVH